MKKIFTVILSAAFALSMCFALCACGDDTESEKSEPTTKATETEAKAATEAPTEAETEAATEAETEAATDASTGETIEFDGKVFTVVDIAEGDTEGIADGEPDGKWVTVTYKFEKKEEGSRVIDSSIFYLNGNQASNIKSIMEKNDIGIFAITGESVLFDVDKDVDLDSVKLEIK